MNNFENNWQLFLGERMDAIRLNPKYYRYVIERGVLIGVQYCYQAQLVSNRKLRGKKNQKERRGRPRMYKRVDQTAAWQKGKNESSIKQNQFRAVNNAYHYAGTIGLPLRGFLTIRWFDTELTEYEINIRFPKLIKSIRSFYQRRGFNFAYIGIHENPYSGFGEPAFNTHILINIPSRVPTAEWLELLKAHIEVAIKATSPRTVDLRQCDSGAKNYMLKGCTYTDAKRAGMLSEGRRWKCSQGDIHFRRVSISENINFAAQLNLNKHYKN